MSKHETRNLILNTAATLFYSKGYNAVGINEIIDEAGIAKATLYNHFKSKEDLCIAYLEHMDKELLSSLKSYLHKKEIGTERILGIISFVEILYKQKTFNGCWCIRTNSEVINNDRINKKIRENKKYLLDLIESEVRLSLPNLSESESINLSQDIYILYEAAVTESFLQRAVWPINRAQSILNRMIN